MRVPALVVPVLAAVSLGGCNDFQPIPITPEITTSALEDGTVGTPYSAQHSAQLKAVGGTGPYTWSLESIPAELNSWLHVDSATGALSGIPTAKVSPALSFVARVTDSWSTPRTSTRTLTLAVKSCTPGATVSCIYASNEQCFLSSLICSEDGSVLGTCSGGALSENIDFCGSSCGACSSTTADHCEGTCMCGAAAACAGSKSCCSGTCIDTQQGDPSNCGSCSNACPTFTAEQLAALHMSGVRCQGGKCIAVCTCGQNPRLGFLTTFGDCDNDLSNGCETSLVGDLNNCGSCGRVCNMGPLSCCFPATGPATPQGPCYTGGCAEAC